MDKIKKIEKYFEEKNFSKAEELAKENPNLTDHLFNLYEQNKLLLIAHDFANQLNQKNKADFYREKYIRQEKSYVSIPSHLN